MTIRFRRPALSLITLALINLVLMNTAAAVRSDIGLNAWRAQGTSLPFSSSSPSRTLDRFSP